MKALKRSNALLVAALIAAALVLQAKGLASPGAIAALTVPIFAFSASFIALHRGTRRLSMFGLWLNAVLLAIFFGINVLAIFVLNVQAKNVAAIIAFQAVLVALPAVANIVALRRQCVAA